MTLDEVLNSLATLVAERATCDYGVSFNAEPHRGICAGSVRYRFRPKNTANALRVFEIVRALYDSMGCDIDFTTPEGCDLFVRTMLSACKELVRNGCRVDLAGLLVYEPQAYSDGRDAWMKPIAVNAAFNRLSSPVKLDKPLGKIVQAQKAAKRKPFNAELRATGGTAPRIVYCAKCGHPNQVPED